MAEGLNPIWFDGLYTTVSSEESKALNTDKTPKVIISSGGMCEGGRIRHHLKHNLWDSRNTILFVGYQANGTLGRIIYDGAESVKIFGEEIDVKAQIALLQGISGHANLPMYSSITVMTHPAAGLPIMSMKHFIFRPRHLIPDRNLIC